MKNTSTNKVNPGKIISLFLTFLFIVPLPLHTEVVEKILAKMEGRIFTLSDFKIAKTFQLVEIVYGETKDINDDSYLKKLIDAELIYRESSLFKIIELTDDEVNEKLNFLKENMGKKFDFNLQKFQISEEYLRKLIREKLSAKKYFELRKNFFLGFGEEIGKAKMEEWLISSRNKASLKIISEVS
ncbi:hypothetical protein KKB18_03375 [bacterium]|nr:hypothetical protein [bacterium]